MAERAGGEGLAGAGCHLNQRARLVGGQRDFQRPYRIDLAVAQALGVERRHCLQTRADGGLVREPTLQSLRAMERKDPARPRRWIGVIAEQDLGAGRDVFEPDLAFLSDQVFGNASDVSRCLL